MSPEVVLRGRERAVVEVERQGVERRHGAESTRGVNLVRHREGVAAAGAKGGAASPRGNTQAFLHVQYKNNGAAAFLAL